MGRWVVVSGPVGGFEVEVAAEEGVEGLAGGMGHFVGAGAGAVVPFVVLARSIWDRGEGFMDVGITGAGVGV